MKRATREEGGGGGENKKGWTSYQRVWQRIPRLEGMRDAQVEKNNRRRVPILFRDRDYRTRYLGAEDKNKNAMPRG